MWATHPTFRTQQTNQNIAANKSKHSSYHWSPFEVDRNHSLVAASQILKLEGV
jgi:hypothetical protein